MNDGDRPNPFADTPGLREVRESVKCKGFEIENCPNKRRYDRGIYGGLCMECAERKKGSPIVVAKKQSRSLRSTEIPSRASSGLKSPSSVPKIPKVDPQVNIEQVVAMMDLGVEMIFKVGDRRFRLQEVSVADKE